MQLLPEMGEPRLKSMDEAGITVQILSNTGPGPDLVPGADGIAMARAMNDYLADAVARHPDRFGVSPCCRCKARRLAPAELSAASSNCNFPAR